MQTLSEVMADEGRYCVKIKVGALISQDFRVLRWPECFPPGDEQLNPNLVFYAKWNGRWWDCIRSGYGIIGDYGSGSIFVHEKNGVIFL